MPEEIRWLQHVKLLAQFKMFLTQCKLSKYLGRKRSSNPNVLSFSCVSQKSALVHIHEPKLSASVPKREPMHLKKS